MRRSSLFSTVTLVGLAALMAAWFVTGVGAASKRCLKGCKTMKPPGCCEPPPCEFVFELNGARAWARSHAIAAGQTFLGVLDETVSDEKARYTKSVNETFRKERRKYAACPKNTFYDRPSIWMESATCNIGVMTESGFQQQTLDQIKATHSSCEEVIDAEYRKAEWEQAYCRALKNEPGVAETLKESQLQDQLAAEKAVESLEQSIIRFWSTCNRFKDPKLAQAVAKLGVPALKDQMPSKPRSKKAKRAGGGR